MLCSVVSKQKFLLQINQYENSNSKDFTLCCSSVHQKRSEPEPSCVSMRSDESIGHPVNFNATLSLKYTIFVK